MQLLKIRISKNCIFKYLKALMEKYEKSQIPTFCTRIRQGWYAKPSQSMKCPKKIGQVFKLRLGPNLGDHFKTTK